MNEELKQMIGSVMKVTLNFHNEQTKLHRSHLPPIIYIGKDTYERQALPHLLQLSQ